MPRRSAQRPSDNAHFYGEDILMALELDPNEAYVAVARLCETLGISLVDEEKRIQAHAVLAAGSRRMVVDVDEREEEATCLRVELIPLWLASVDATQVDSELRERLELYQRESASVLWQSFRPQGFGTADEMLPTRYEQTPAEQAYVSALAMATLARHQMLIERQLVAAQANRQDQGADPWSVGTAVDDAHAARLTQMVRRVAHTLSERSRRNEYGGAFSGLYRQFGISSYRRMPPARLHEALEWLERWHGDLLGEPEPPPDI